MFHLRPRTDGQNNKLYCALDLHLAVLLLEYRRQRPACRLAIEYLLHIWTIWVLEEGRAMFGEKFPGGGQGIECKFVLDE